jgi:hypothetical protein
MLNDYSKKGRPYEKPAKAGSIEKIIEEQIRRWIIIR